MPFIMIDEQDCEGNEMMIFQGIFTSTGKATRAIQPAFDLEREAYLRKATRSSKIRQAEIDAYWGTAKLKIQHEADGSFIWVYGRPANKWKYLRLIWVGNNQLWPMPPVVIK